MVKTTPKERKRVKYTEAELQMAIVEVKSGETLRSISRKYGIPRTTLLYKREQDIPRIGKTGPPTILTVDEEMQLVSWFMHMSKSGFPVTKTHLLTSVMMLIKQFNRDNPFTNGIPGRSWLDAFLKRHPELTQRVAQNLTMTRASVSEAAVRGWFSEVAKRLDEKELKNIDGSRVFNCDESAVILCPRGDEVLVKRREKSVYNFINKDDKECLTTLFMANATGILAPPLVLFSYERIPSAIANSMPDSWAIGKTNNGWMTGESFFEYIVNIFHPWLIASNIELPIVLFVDGHCSHMTMALSDFCSNNGIVLIALFPNATHIMQPLDVAFFRSLKGAWRRKTHEWRIESNGKRLTRENFAHVLQMAINSLNVKNIISSGFQATGLYPFSANAINYTKLQTGKSSASENSTAAETMPMSTQNDNLLCSFEKFIPLHVLNKFKNIDSDKEWNGNVEDKSLFLVWRSIRRNLPTVSLHDNPLGKKIIVKWKSHEVSIQKQQEAAKKRKERALATEERKKRIDEMKERKQLEKDAKKKKD